MIFRFRMITEENENFFRDIDIREDQTFLDLHNAIQEFTGYDKSQVASFFITDNQWRKKQEIALMDMGDDQSDDVKLMKNVVVSEYIKKEKEKLLYVFDYFSGRAFFLELTKKIKEPQKGKKYPICANAAGSPPPQVVLGDLNIGDIFDEELDEIYGKNPEEENLEFDNSYDENTSEFLDEGEGEEKEDW